MVILLSNQGYSPASPPNFSALARFILIRVVSFSALALYLHRFLENNLAPAFAKRVLGTSAWSQIIVGGQMIWPFPLSWTNTNHFLGSNFGEVRLAYQHAELYPYGSYFTAFGRSFSVCAIRPGHHTCKLTLENYSEQCSIFWISCRGCVSMLSWWQYWSKKIIHWVWAVVYFSAEPHLVTALFLHYCEDGRYLGVDNCCLFHSNIFC